MRQAPMTAHTYLLQAVRDIDAVLGKGFAREHPELIGQYMITASIDYCGGIVARAVEMVSGEIESVHMALDDLAATPKGE
jgi:hypothetical protein